MTTLIGCNTGGVRETYRSAANTGPALSVVDIAITPALKTGDKATLFVDEGRPAYTVGAKKQTTISSLSARVRSESGNADFADPLCRPKSVHCNDWKLHRRRDRNRRSFLWSIRRSFGRHPIAQIGDSRYPILDYRDCIIRNRLGCESWRSCNKPSHRGR